MKACVLLSTYNGERYLVQQLESLLGQSISDIAIFIRDDGSKDGTPQILQRFSQDHRVTVFMEENIGVVRSFFSLLERAPEADVYAFCDQDDWWEPNKLQRASEILRGVSRAAAVCCRIAVTDERLNVVRHTDAPPKGYTFANSLVENVVTGCAVCFNSKARTEVLECMPRASEVLMHDWWIYQVISARGLIFFDPEPGVWYRQHGGNTVGSTSGLAQFNRRLERFINGRNIGLLARQMRELSRCMALRLSAEQKIILDSLSEAIEVEGRWSRIYRAFSVPVYRQSWWDTMIMRVLIGAGRV